MTSHAERCEALTRSLRSTSTGAIGLAKETSNLFRDRIANAKTRLDVRSFDHVLEVNAAAGWMDVEGMTPYERAVDGALAHDVMPAVVPELKTITVGGAAAGVGIEATSFRRGLVHETLEEIDVLVADGTIVRANRTNEHRALFYGFPNSYGTLGYALRLRARTIPVRPYVRVERSTHRDAADFFEDLLRACRSDADFVDGVVFAPDHLVLNVARFADHAPFTSDYTFESIYYRSVAEKPLDYLTTHDYIWRWDTDWFWCSKNVFAQQPLVRRLYGRARLGSRTYTKIMRWNSRVGVTRAIDRLRGRHPESVIQDVDIPLENAPAFLDFFLARVGIKPVWICPIGPSADAHRYPLYRLDPEKLYVNFGFWDVVRTTEHHPAGYFNRLVEKEVERLGGIKSLYSSSYYSADEFWAIYDQTAYRELKSRYDPKGVFGDLYSKTVLGH